MKLHKNMHILIEPKENGLIRFAQVYNKVSRGEYVKPWKGIGFPNLAEFRRTFTDKRVELLKAIKKHEPKSIYGLAKILKRDYKNVYDDVKNLRMLGFISKKELKVTFDKLVLEIPV